MTLSDKVALVSGASRGVGRGIARGLGEAGAIVYVTGRTVQRGPTAEPGTIERVAREVDELRSRSYQKNIGLVVVVDADTQGYRGRVQELQEAIATRTSGGSRSPTERIAFVVPAYEIETWYVHLCCPQARPVDELRDDRWVDGPYTEDQLHGELDRYLKTGVL